MSDHSEIISCEEYFKNHLVDAIHWRAERLLKDKNNIRERSDCFEKLAYTIAKIEQPAAREQYITHIAKTYTFQATVFRKMVEESLSIVEKQKKIKTVRKNKVLKLEGNAKTFPFFSEIVRKDGTFDKIIVNKVRFIQLLRSFGFLRYEVGENDKYTFVKIHDNVIKVVPIEEIVDDLEKFIQKDYDFNGADLVHVDAEMLINKFYDGLNTLLSKKLFSRLKSDAPILINKDKANITYLYYTNGFVEITASGYELKSYEEMEGSVWDHQVMERNFNKLDEAARVIDDGIDEDQRNYDGDFADFVWKICGRDPLRFKSLCCIIGYLVHDFYNYTLKMIYFTDSTISEDSQGRTGKTLLLKLIGRVRSFVEIPGKNFNVYDEKRYQLVKLGTQLVHLNDVDNKGKNRFVIEPMFNDITEGLAVRALWLPPFVQYSKLAVSGNGSLFVAGDSAMDRVLEFEMSNFFSMRRRPVDYYGQRLGDDWDAEEWNRFDNFICFCSMLFHKEGLSVPPTINLHERKLRQFTRSEFLEFMEDRIQQKTDKREVLEFNKKDLYNEFKVEYTDYKDLKQGAFNKWLKSFGVYRYGEEKMSERKSNGQTFIKYGEE